MRVVNENQIIDTSHQRKRNENNNQKMFVFSSNLKQLQTKANMRTTWQKQKKIENLSTMFFFVNIAFKSLKINLNLIFFHFAPLKEKTTKISETYFD
jgi:hypothetical protein